MTKPDLKELMERRETLTPELLPYVHPSNVTGGDMVHHPLIIELFYDPERSALINERFKYVSQAAKEAFEQKKWGTYIFRHQRPYRLDAMLRAADAGLTGAEYWRLVGEVRTDSENIHQNFAEWKRIWQHDEDGKQASMNAEEIEAMNKLPAKIEVWRGTKHRASIRGISWTMDRDRAAWFAKRFVNVREGERALLVSSTVLKRNIKAVFLGRNESEIVSLKVKLANVEKLS